mmetsp:Transcript_10363/g.9154  ORF Transcript_10363/g.9154 Transcript_10363/m.9154 type:complete len:95 (+) Transcript_10363:360-644(+)
MISGTCPFTDTTPERVFQRIEKDQLYIPDNLSEEAQDLVKKLLEKNPNKRLGSGPEDSESIKEHPFFSDIDWEKLKDKNIDTPFVPPVEDEEDL